MNVTVELDELAELHSTAKLSEYRQLELQHAQKEIEDLRAECERLAATKPEAEKPREVSPLLRQRIENAKDVLRQIVPVPADSDGSFGEVAGDRFNAVYKTLQELYDVTRAEVL